MNSTDFSYLRSVKKFDPSVIKGANRMTDKTAIEKAARKVLASRDACTYGGQEVQIRLMDELRWSPSKSIVDSSSIHELREALASTDAEKPADICKTDCEFYEGCLERFTHKKAEKPAEDAVEVAFTCLRKKTKGRGVMIDLLDVAEWTESAALLIQSFAESYHAEQCKACKAITVTDNRVCRTCGNYTTCDTPFYKCVGKYWQPLPEAPK